jgi:phosphoglycolate phosphatase
MLDFKRMHQIEPKDQNRSCVVLFDIDGTLLTGPAGRETAGMRSMHHAAKTLAGESGGYRNVAFAGRTDRQIARLLLVEAGHADPARSQIDELVGVYVARLAREIETRPYGVIGSPREVVGRLRERGAIVGLGTGNVRAGSLIKLESAGIADLFEIDRGGYGDDGQTRAEVLETGARRCDPSRTLPVVIVGDTPHDVHAAHEIGAPCIGVPYRHNDAETLKRAGADAIAETIDGRLVETVFRLVNG